VNDETKTSFDEGKRIFREALLFARNQKLVAQAKQHLGVVCVVCNFDFGAKYGFWGEGYIECHHLTPLSTRDEQSAKTSLSEVAVFCSNCHCMVHRRNPPLTIQELKTAMAKAATSRQGNS
jgi:5-methylcytosine-specific restriction protein A